MKTIFSSQFSVLSFQLLALCLSVLSASAQNVGDRIIKERIATTGQETIRYWPKGSLKLWGDNASQLPASIAIGTGLTLSGSPLTLSASATGGAQDAFILNDEAGDTLTALESGLGWRDSRLTIQGVPGGSLQMYETGDPLEGVLYWAGRIQVGSLEAASLTADIDAALITSGTISAAIVRNSTPQPLRAFHDGASFAGAYGLTYGATGPGGQTEPTTPGTYFPEILVVDGDPDANYLQGRIRTAADLRTDLGLGTLATQSPTGTPTGSKFLRDDYTWQTVSGGTVTGGIVQRIFVNETSRVLSGTGTVQIYHTVALAMTEGTEFLSASITPTSATNRIRVTAVVVLGTSVSAHMSMICGRSGDTTARRYAMISQGSPRTDMVSTGTLVLDEEAGTTSAITYKIRAGGSSAGTFRLNRAGGGDYPIGTASTLTLEEYTP